MEERSGKRMVVKSQSQSISARKGPELPDLYTHDQETYSLQYLNRRVKYRSVSESTVVALEGSAQRTVAKRGLLPNSAADQNDKQVVSERLVESIKPNSSIKTIFALTKPKARLQLHTDFQISRTIQDRGIVYLFV